MHKTYSLTKLWNDFNTPSDMHSQINVFLSRKKRQVTVIELMIHDSTYCASSTWPVKNVEYKLSLGNDALGWKKHSFCPKNGQLFSSWEGHPLSLLSKTSLLHLLPFVQYAYIIYTARFTFPAHNGLDLGTQNAKNRPKGQRLSIACKHQRLFNCQKYPAQTPTLVANQGLGIWMRISIGWQMRHFSTSALNLDTCSCVLTCHIWLPELTQLGLYNLMF